MKYSFKILREEFEKLGIILNDDKMREFELIDLKGNITEIGIVLSDNCNHNIKIIAHDTNIIENSFNGSILSQYYKIKDYLIELELNKFYPLKVILEVLVNSIVHRDYKYKGDTVLHIFKDKIELTSLGGLIEDLTVEGIKLGISEPRNINLMKIFKILGLVKAYGDGLSMVINEYKKYDISPEIISIGGVFKVILPKIDFLLYNKKIKKQHKKILDLFNTYSEITNIMIQNHLGVKSTSAIIYLKELQDLDLIKKIKIGRNVSYKKVYLL